PPPTAPATPPRPPPATPPPPPRAPPRPIFKKKKESPFSCTVSWARSCVLETGYIGSYQLTEDYRSLARPSSPLTPRASTVYA
ncbi:hypothetical protein ACVGXE_04565, partial [Escherichia coli]